MRVLGPLAQAHQVLHKSALFDACDSRLQGGHKHIILKGAGPGNRKWTSIAEDYPYPIADILALAIPIAIGSVVANIDFEAEIARSHSRQARDRFPRYDQTK